METIGSLFFLVRYSSGLERLTKFQLDGSSLTASDEGGNERTVVEPHGCRSAELIAAVGRLVAIKRFAADVRPAPPYLLDPATTDPLPYGTSLLEVTVMVPLQLWAYREQQVRNWLSRERKAAVKLLGALVPLGGVSGDSPSTVLPGGPVGPRPGAVAGGGPPLLLGYNEAVWEAVGTLLEQDGGRERYTLVSCFRELPTVAQSSSAAAAAPPPSLAPAAAPSSYDIGAYGVARAPLLDLPHDLLEGIFCRLGPLDLARLRATCRRMAEEGDLGGAVPGLQLTLFPHQRAAVGWMVRQERRPTRLLGEGPGQGQPYPSNGLRQGSGSCKRQQHPAAGGGWGELGWRHPQYVELRSSGGRVLWADLGTAELHTTRPAEAARIRGGFFCDEPGLGKTITAVSLVLKTIGQLPAAPQGAHVTWTTNRDCRRVAYYTLGSRGGGPGTWSLNDTEDARSGSGGARRIADEGGGGSSKDCTAASGCTAKGSGAAGAAAAAAAAAVTPSSPPGRAGSLPLSLGPQPQASSAAWKTALRLPDQASAGAASTISPMRTRRAAAAAAALAAAAPAATSGAEIPMAVATTVPGAPSVPAIAFTEAGTGGVGKGGAQTGGARGSLKPNQEDASKPAPPLSLPQQLQQQRGNAHQQPQDLVVQPQPQQPARKRVRFAGADDDSPDIRAKDPPQEATLASGPQTRAAQGAAAGASGGIMLGRDRPGVGATIPGSAPSPGRCSRGRAEQGAGVKSGVKMGLGKEGVTETAEAVQRGGKRQRGGRGGGAGGGRRRRGPRGRATARESPESTGGDSSSDDDGGGKGGEEEHTWVQCDGCHIWRKLPKGTVVSESDPWFCHMHPVPDLAYCSAPADGFEADAVFESAPGYLKPGEPRGNPQNVTYFEDTLRAVASRMKRGESCVNALRWLCDLDPKRLATGGPGVQMPTAVRAISNGYAKAFLVLDLEQVQAGRSSRTGAGAKEGGRNGSSGGNPKGGSSGGQAGGQGRGQEGRRVATTVGGGKAGKHTWRAAPCVKGLLLDVQALAQAVDNLTSGAGSTRVYLSPATLVVLPPTIIDHWQRQIQKHVAPRTLRVCVLDHLDPRNPLTAINLAWEYDIVITTFNCLSLAKTVDKKEGLSRLSQLLLEVHWLRVILDEGHMLGASTAITNKLQVACSLLAERRWVMTGTPTPATSSGSAASHLQPLLAFLHHEPYGKNSAAWQAVVQRPLEACRPEGRRRLMHLLLENMIRASKADVLKLPRLHRRRILLDFEPQHAASYNELVEVVRRNLLTSDWCDEDHRESLLSARNSRWSRQMMSNVWLSCCVAGSTNSEVKEADLIETLQLLAGRLGLPVPWADLPGGVPVGPPWLDPSHPLWATEEALRHGTCCQVCSEFVRQPMVTPCGHLVCLDCTATDREYCPLSSCRTPYVMQAVEDPARLNQNKRPKWPVPRELIEWQPVYHQQGAQGVDGGTWSANWRITQSSKITYMLQRLREIGAAPNLPPGPPPQAPGSITTAAAPTFGAVPGAAPPPSPSSTPAAVAAGPSSPPARPDSSSSSGGVPSATASAPSSAPLLAHYRVKAKAIVFTQFGLHMQLIEASLMQAGISFTILARAFTRSEREEALAVFQHDPCCGVLIMDQVGAVGLDLSFASYVLLMEPLEDSSLEEQVISRAHRMGASRDVVVETLIMRGSAEEALLNIDRRAMPLAISGRAGGGDCGLPPASAPAAATAAAPLAAAAGCRSREAGAGSTSGGPGGGGAGGGDGGGGSQRERGGAGAGAGAEEHEHDGGVQVDRRALRNRLFLLLEKVRLRGNVGPRVDSPNAPSGRSDHGIISLAASGAALLSGEGSDGRGSGVTGPVVGGGGGGGGRSAGDGADRLPGRGDDSHATEALAAAEADVLPH